MRPGYRAWAARVEQLGGCEHPVYLRGRTIVRARATGAVLAVFDAASQPGGVLMLPCGNRRASRCSPCSQVYKDDTFHMLNAGLMGGKGVPESVASHPRVFATFTAPSFGPVHHRVIGEGGAVKPCTPRRERPVCEHGAQLLCMERHAEGDPLVGAPLCAECFDYAGAVLFNAHAGKLWHLTVDDLRRVMLPSLSGLTKRKFVETARVSFAKVAEYQARGLVHFHAVIRIDGADGPGSTPPGWASVELLDGAIHATAERVRVVTADSPVGIREFGWGREVDVKAIPIGDSKVAGYVAKYATKGAECVGAVDRSLCCRECEGTGLFGACVHCRGAGLRVPLEDLDVPEHARLLMATTWELGALVEYRKLRLRAWAHQIGFGGHFSTKSRLYSVTLSQLRQERADFATTRAGGIVVPDDAVRESVWEFAGAGYTGVQIDIARQIREDIADYRELVRVEVADLKALETRNDWAGPV